MSDEHQHPDREWLESELLRLQSENDALKEELLRLDGEKLLSGSQELHEVRNVVLPHASFVADDGKGYLMFSSANATLLRGKFRAAAPGQRDGELVVSIHMRDAATDFARKGVYRQNMAEGIFAATGVYVPVDRPSNHTPVIVRENKPAEKKKDWSHLRAGHNRGAHKTDDNDQ